jgi:hypothetical protein
MAVQKKSLISNRAVNAKAQSSEKSTSIGESKPVQANALTRRFFKGKPANLHSMKKKD